MKRLIFLLWCMSLLFAGCETNDPLLPDVDVNQKSAKTTMVPIKGELQSIVNESLNGIPVYGILSGSISHLGELTADKSTWYTISVEMDEQTWTISWEMFGAVCAANGDLLKYTLSGSFNIPENNMSGEVNFDGGTGRFAQAQGNMEFTGYADDPTNIAAMYMEGEGMITNVGSSHGDENPLVAQNESIGKLLIEAWDTHNAEMLTSLFADEFSYTEVMGRSFTDKESLAMYVLGSISGAPDSRFETVSSVANEKYVASEWVWKGTNTVGWQQMGIPATDIYFELPGASIMEIENGKIIWVKDYWDRDTFLQLIGIIL
ncbi:ester cyclase [Mangrovibacterium lignilyticum]|uniref:ester cyclase n=1 Tax=Mangrovibacterium lignilyticum TaxID=2668052 RepID=UPI0013D7D77A|nr:nuclear transport factor 2 family protein [Mangrovibacterium lignilyticum]